MADMRQDRIAGLTSQLADLQSELHRVENSVAVLREARNVLYAEITREEHGIALGDLIVWQGEQRRQRDNAPRAITLRGVVIGVPMRDRLLVQRVTCDGKLMDQTVYVPVSRARLSGKRRHRPSLGTPIS